MNAYSEENTKQFHLELENVLKDRLDKVGNIQLFFFETLKAKELYI